MLPQDSCNNTDAYQRNMVSGMQLCQGNKIIIIQLINQHAQQHRVNYETGMSTQMYKYTGTAELHKKEHKTKRDKRACCLNIPLKCYQATL